MVLSYIQGIVLFFNHHDPFRKAQFLNAALFSLVFIGDALMSGYIQNVSAVSPSHDQKRKCFQFNTIKTN